MLPIRNLNWLAVMLHLVCIFLIAIKNTLLKYSTFYIFVKNPMEKSKSIIQYISKLFEYIMYIQREDIILQLSININMIYVLRQKKTAPIHKKSLEVKFYLLLNETNSDAAWFWRQLHILTASMFIKLDLF